MTVSLAQYRAVIGIFNCRNAVISCHVSNLNKNLISLFEVLLSCWQYFESAFLFLLTLVYMFIILPCHEDVEPNPGPRKQKPNYLSVCPWNLNSLTAHNFSKLAQLQAYNSIYKYELICLSETYLDSSTPDNLFEIEGYKVIRVDHPDNIKRGGVCIYYKESLPVRVINTTYFKEALLLEMSCNSKNVMVSVIYRSPNQSNDEFEVFLSNFQMLLDEINNRKPSLSVITGDFNAGCSSWWSNDINTTEGLKLFSSTSSNGLTQIIKEPTHIQTNSSSCIDLIFIDQPNLSVNSGVHASLHPNCHHQIVHSLSIYYPPPYQRLIWDYKKADEKIIRKALDSVNWERLFHGKNINAQILALNETILNVFQNYVPNKYITIDDKDPVWMNEIIKSKIKTKNLYFKQYIQNGRFESDFVFLESLIIELNDLISLTKKLYYENLAKKTKQSAAASKNLLVNSEIILQRKKNPNNSTSFDRR